MCQEEEHRTSWRAGTCSKAISYEDGDRASGCTGPHLASQSGLPPSLDPLGVGAWVTSLDRGRDTPGEGCPGMRAPWYLVPMSPAEPQQPWDPVCHCRRTAIQDPRKRGRWGASPRPWTGNAIGVATSDQQKPHGHVASPQVVERETSGSTPTNPQAHWLGWPVVPHFLTPAGHPGLQGHQRWSGSLVKTAAFPWQ